MSYKCLEINRLTESGDNLKTVRCYAGRVTVFRARNTRELESYAKALCGRETQERFSVLLDGVTFNSSEHCVLGFSPVKFSEEVSVADLLLAQGIELPKLEGVLLEYGLGGLTKTKCALLNKEQSAAVSLLCAIFATNQVLILNDPFKDIESKWREKFAKTLIESSFSKMTIVVLVNLTYRPECWIDNEIIARVQLDKRERSKTIGISSVDMEVVREVAKTSHIQGEATKLVKTNIKARHQKNRYPIYSSIGLIVGILVIVLLMHLIRQTKQSSMQVVKDSSKLENADTAVNVSSISNPLDPEIRNNKVGTVDVVKGLEREANGAGSLVLAMYDESIKQAVINAFQGKVGKEVLANSATIESSFNRTSNSDVSNNEEAQDEVMNLEEEKPTLTEEERETLEQLEAQLRELE